MAEQQQSRLERIRAALGQLDIMSQDTLLAAVRDFKIEIPNPHLLNVEALRREVREALKGVESLEEVFAPPDITAGVDLDDVSRALDAANAEVIQRRQELEELRTEVERLKTDNDNREQTLKSIREESDTLRTQVEELTRQNQIDGTLLKETQARRDQLQADLGTASRAVADLCKKKDKFRNWAYGLAVGLGVAILAIGTLTWSTIHYSSAYDRKAADYTSLARDYFDLNQRSAAMTAPQQFDPPQIAIEEDEDETSVVLPDREAPAPTPAPAPATPQSGTLSDLID